MAYSPFLVGVAHYREMLYDVLKEVDRLKPKSVGVETSEFAIKNWIRIGLSPSDMQFWKGLIRELQYSGIQVVYLRSNQIAEQIIREQQRLMQKGITTQMVFENPDKYPEGKRLVELMRDKDTEYIELTARKKFPEMLIMGLFHAEILRKNLRIPRERFRRHLIPSKEAQKAIGISIPKQYASRKRRKFMEGLRFHVKEHRRSYKKSRK